MIRSTALALLIATPLMAAPPITKEVIASGGRTREYYLFVPQRASAAAAAPMPLIITLHGSGHDGRILVEHWQKLADKEGIVLAGPSSIDPQHWGYPVDGARTAPRRRR